MTAKIILDSITATGARLTTMEVTFHRFVLAEFNTHRVFSRNSASSRAIPVEKQLNRVVATPAFPVEWRAEQPGMQGGDILEGQAASNAWILFDRVYNQTILAVTEYLDVVPKEDRLHKSLINRLLEPFMWHTVIVSSTEWDNFFAQRVSPLAQPEIRVAAEQMLEVYNRSTPRQVERGSWHLPYVQSDELHYDLNVLKKISVARCARVSYLNHDGVRDFKDDVKLFDRLVSADPMHASPLEHVARPYEATDGRKEGNFDGWVQLRHVLSTDM